MNFSLFFIYALLTIVSIYSYLFFTETLGEGPPDQGVHHQSTAEQSEEVVNSKLGQSGGLPLKNSDPDRQAEQKKTDGKKSALEYLLEARDLAAQEGVWRASNIIAIIGLIQTVIGIAGLFAIIYTLKATRSALTEARKTTRQAILSTDAADRTAQAAENAERAHVFLEVRTRFCGDNEKPSDEIENKQKLRIEIGLRNYGSTPATHVNWTISRNKIGGGRVMDNASIDTMGPDEFFEIVAIEESTGSFFSIGEWAEARKQYLAVNGFIFYGDVFDPKRRHRVNISNGNISFRELYTNNFKPISSIDELSQNNSLRMATDYRLASVQRPYFRADQEVVEPSRER